LDELINQIENVKKFNKTLKLRGCFVTQFAKNQVNMIGLEVLRRNKKYKLLQTYIRRSVKIDESTFRQEPILNVSPKCTAAKDYINLVKEYLGLNEV
jgi:chromosome partitioning protein